MIIRTLRLFILSSFFFFCKKYFVVTWTYWEVSSKFESKSKKFSSESFLLSSKSLNMSLENDIFFVFIVLIFFFKMFSRNETPLEKSVKIKLKFVAQCYFFAQKLFHVKI